MIYTMNQITNEMLVSHFKVEIINEFSARDQKGRLVYISDLRKDYFKNARRIEKQQQRAKKKTVDTQQVKAEHIVEIFQTLQQRFPNRDVLIRQTQPGLRMPEIGCNAYCIVSATDKHVLNLDSTEFKAKDLQGLFSDYKQYNNQKRGVTLSGLSCEDIVQCIDLLIETHESL